MRGVVLFVAGVLVGLAVQTAVAQKRTEVYVNHVGLSVPSVDAALAFYTQKMGFREGFRQTSPEGKLVSAYVQVSKNTFIELQEANAQRPAGVNHFGLAVDSICGTSVWRRRSLRDPTRTSAVRRSEARS